MNKNKILFVVVVLLAIGFAWYNKSLFLGLAIVLGYSVIKGGLSLIKNLT